MKCALCREDITGAPVVYKGKSYCCEACAFDASLRLGSMCGSQSTVQAGLRFEQKRATSNQETCRVIAIDGPVAVGKSTVGKLVARRLGFNFVDTGAMYRGLTWKALQAGVDPDDETKLTDLALATDMKLLPSEDRSNGYRILIDGADATDGIRSPQVESAVSQVSRIPSVRRVLVDKQRRMADEGKMVMIGRDISTVVLPQADLKVFLDASPEERAGRRYRELKDSGKAVEYDQVLADLKRRDLIDSTRVDSPLKPAADSKTVNTDRMTLDQVVDRVCELARERRCS